MAAYEEAREWRFIDYVKAYGIYTLGLVVALLVAGVMIFGEKSPLPNVSQPDQSAEAFFSGWDGANKELVSAVKASMHDPKSFEHVETRYTDRGDSFGILMTFRGTNGFGATVIHQVTADIDKQSRKLSSISEVN